MSELSEKQVTDILTEAADLLTVALQYPVTYAMLAEAYGDGVCTITYLGENAGGGHEYRVDYDGGSVLVVLEDLE